MTPADSEWVTRAEEVADDGLNPVNEATLRFAIGKYYDDVGDFGRAFRSYQRANELNKTRATPYDREDRTRFVNNMVRVFTPETFARAQAGASDSARPVFVVGMPRSGTSLVEQIIASHPEAWGAGELNFWQIAARGHPRRCSMSRSVGVSQRTTSRYWRDIPPARGASWTRRRSTLIISG